MVPKQTCKNGIKKLYKWYQSKPVQMLSKVNFYVCYQKQPYRNYIKSKLVKNDFESKLVKMISNIYKLVTTKKLCIQGISCCNYFFGIIEVQFDT